MTTTIFGGLLIGAGAGLLFLLEGRIAGVSGLLARGLDPNGSARPWRLLFVAALAMGGGIVAAVVPGVLPGVPGVSTARLVTAGALVGIGAGLANGCTSGHGLCGVARGSTRPIAAVATFMALGMVTVLVVRTIGGLR
jgi:uncharacterized protein